MARPCAEGCVLPELQGYVLIIGQWKVIKGHCSKKNISHEFKGLGEILRFGGLDKKFWGQTRGWVLLSD